MSKIKLDVESPYTGLHVDFIAPCDCTAVDGLQIGDDAYTVVNSLGVAVTGVGGAWAVGAVVSVVLDVENKNAYLVNHTTINATKTATLVASNWSSSAPYTQTVSVSGVLVSDDPFVDVYLEGISDGTAIIEAWSTVGRVSTTDGSITAYCYEEKPTIDIPIILKVVR